MRCLLICIIKTVFGNRGEIFYARRYIADMKFFKWEYIRPDYLVVMKKINNCINKMQNAMSNQLFCDVYLGVKRK